jgi:hypothetical protein
MKRACELRQQAERYRRLNRQISDPAAMQAICELAGEFEMTAAELEKHLSVSAPTKSGSSAVVPRDATWSFGLPLSANWKVSTCAAGDVPDALRCSTCSYCYCQYLRSASPLKMIWNG